MYFCYDTGNYLALNVFTASKGSNVYILLAAVELILCSLATRPRGLTDKASDFESEDCEFESRRGQFFTVVFNLESFNFDCLFVKSWFTVSFKFCSGLTEVHESGDQNLSQSKQRPRSLFPIGKQPK